MDAELVALASSGASTLVGLMVSDGWAQVRGRVARLLARDGDVSSAEGELERSRDEVIAARTAGDDDAGTQFEDEWAVRFRRFLRSDPDAARQLFAELRAAAVNNEVSGGTFNGPVVQAGAIHGGITFTVQAPQPTGPATPDEVPPLTVPFVSRTSDLALLNACCPDGSAGIGVVGLYGMPGVGKTATVSHWAQSRRESFPDGRLYVDYADLRDCAEGGDVSEALHRCLVSLGVPEASIPRDFARRTATFRTTSADRRLLVVLDNVNQAAQVVALIPKGSGSAVLAASAGQLAELALDGARFVPLEPLNDEDALQLLASRCGDRAVDADPEAARRLVRLCGGLPVALHLVAARLITTRGLTMTRLAAELADETTRLAGMTLRERSVSAALGLTYRDLPAAEARLYRCLGGVPGRTFDAAVAAIAGGVGAESASAGLEVLRDNGLTDTDAKGRWRMHDLVRLHARERAAEEDTPQERAAVLERIVRHYQVLTVLADRAIRLDRLRITDTGRLVEGMPDPFTGDEAVSPLDWLEAEHENILAVLRAAGAAGMHTQVWQTVESFTVLFLHHRHVAVWKESLELGIAGAAAAAAPAAEGRLHSLLSRPLMDLGDLDAAGTELEAAIACAEISGHTVLRASVQEFAGRYYEHVDLTRAMDAYRRSAALNAEGGEPRGEALAVYFLGCALDKHGDHAQALETLHRAHRMLIAVDDPRMAARAELALGLALDHLGDTPAATEQLTAAAETLGRLDATHYEAEARVALADLAERVGDRATELRHLRRALEIYEATAHPAAEAIGRRVEELETD